ncbi:hypothetical protein T09_907 [Trichinella sp. T9]|nr:hypothetical protein T09_907 [Trichinella sp. T9]
MPLNFHVLLQTNIEAYFDITIRCKCIKFSCFAHNLDSVCQFKNCCSLVKFSECIDQRMYHQKIANQKYFQNKSQMKKS